MSPALELAGRPFGPDDPSLPLTLVLHGLLGQGRNWQAIAKRLAHGRRVLAVDLRNHGQSPHDPCMTYAAMAGDLAALIAKAGGRASIIGHSMGGKAAMMLALTAPELVDRLVVIDIAPVTYRHREFATYLDAMARIDPGSLARRTDVDAALADVDPDPRIRAFLASNLDSTPGAMRWLPNLKALQAALDDILGFAPPAGARFERPCLFLTGGKSAYVREEQRAAILELFPKATIETIPDAGHWVHADKPAEVIEALEAILPSAN